MGAHFTPASKGKGLSFLRGQAGHLYLLMDILGLSEVKAAAMSLFKDKSFAADHHIKHSLQPGEVNRWLELVVKQICEAAELSYDNTQNYPGQKISFDGILGSHKTLEEKIDQISRDFVKIIESEDDRTKQKDLIIALGFISLTFLEHSKEKRLEKIKEIRRILLCTIIAACVVLKSLAFVLATTSLMAQVAIVGLIGYSAAKTKFPEKTDAIIATLSEATIPESIRSGLGTMSNKVTESGFPEKIRGAIISCFQNAALITNFNKLSEQYQKLTGAELSADKLVKLARTELTKPRI